MKKIIVLFILFISTQVWSSESHIPLDSYDQGPDIPVIGSSLFDKIFSRTLENGSTVYDIPYPLENFVTKLEAIDGDLIHSLFPFSRSLQRPQDDSFNPLLNPRLVLTSRQDRLGITRGKLFLGFVKAKDQLEVISFNDEAGRFEYQIITDFSKNPKVFYVDRGKCISCHQGQAGIFSTPGWNDSTTGPMRHLIFSKLNLEGSENKKRRDAFNKLFGSIDSEEQVAVFDGLVRLSSDIALDERIWARGCSGDSLCRVGLLVNSLSPNSSQANSLIKYSREVLDRSFFKNEQIRFSSFLTSTDIGLKQIVTQYGSAQAVAHSTEALLDIIGNLFNLPQADNPATKRPRSLKNTELVRPLATFNRKDFELLKKEIPDPNKITSIILNLHKENHSIFASDSINKAEIMYQLLKSIASPQAKKYENWINKKTPQKNLFEGSLPPIFQKTELNILSRHCHKCHAVDFKFPPQFLLGEEPQVIEQLKELKPKLIYKLKNSLMPPNKKDQDIFIQTGDYERVMKFLNSL